MDIVAAQNARLVDGKVELPGIVDFSPVRETWQRVALAGFEIPAGRTTLGIYPPTCR